MPLSAGLFLSERKNMEPQCPPRLNVQSLIPTRWTRLPEHAPQVELTRLDERHGWRAQCADSLQVMALHIPEEDRSEGKAIVLFKCSVLYCTFEWYKRQDVVRLGD